MSMSIRNSVPGAFKVTPSHDRNDYEIGLRHALERMKVMDDKGVMNAAAGEYCRA